MKFFDELKWRGMVKDCNDEALAAEVLNETDPKKKATFYIGYDPTGKSLTVGHLVQIVRMRFMQEHGFPAICLVGGATGQIGDPRLVGERKMITVEETLENARLIKAQLEKYLIPEMTTWVNNYDWISKISVIDFLRDYGKDFNINYMLGKDIIKRRLDQGISFTEFSYTILQALDFLKLFKEMNCRIEFGGSDQWGNITAGLDLIRKKLGPNTGVVGLSSPLLTKADGGKIGKSEGGAVWIDENLTSPYELYQYFYNLEDEIVIASLKVLTLLTVEEIQDLERKLAENPEAREAQRRLAQEVTKFVHGEKALKDAEAITEALFNSDFSKLDDEEWKMLSKGLESVEVNADTTVVDSLVELKLASSKREAREFIQSGAITVNGHKVEDVNAKFTKEMSINGHLVVRRGKKVFAIALFK